MTEEDTHLRRNPRLATFDLEEMIQDALEQWGVNPLLRLLYARINQSNFEKFIECYLTPHYGYTSPTGECRWQVLHICEVIEALGDPPRNLRAGPSYKEWIGYLRRMHVGIYGVREEESYANDLRKLVFRVTIISLIMGHHGIHLHPLSKWEVGALIKMTKILMQGGVLQCATAYVPNLFVLGLFLAMKGVYGPKDGWVDLSSKLHEALEEFLPGIHNGMFYVRITKRPLINEGTRRLTRTEVLRTILSRI